ncbi:MAG: alpha-2-macroglobulin, partial [Candidatus Symbiothrix sp.]|nr:alpha-2-macroglobulin [Candidatus Symbiothrix sp.]
MKRKGFILLISAVLTSFLTFWSCNREVVPASEFTPYISAYTGGLVSPSSNILIELANEQTNIEPNTEVKSKLFSFSPSVKGKAFWLNNRTIEFIPENDALKSGTEYEVKFKLDKIVRVPKRLKTFAFTFRVEEKTGEIRLDSPDIVDPAFVNIHGEIRFNEVPEKALVEKALSAKTNDNQLFIPVVTTTESDGVFRFSIDKIARKKTNVDLTVQIDGKTLGLANSLSESITIPALDIFRVILAEQIYEPENGIQIVLTDPVSQSQDIRGLVTLSGISQYTYHVENNKIKLYFDPKEVGETTVKVDQGLRNTKEDKLESEFFTNLTIKRLNPQIELLSDGNILPNSEQLMLPFRAVNLYAVDIRIIKIFENNVLMFLQTNTLKGSDELRRSGRLIYKKTLRLDGDPSKNIHNWQRYAINLAPMIKQEPGAIYRVEFSFKQSYSAFDCGSNEMNGSLINQQEMLVRLQSDEISEKEEAYWDSPEVYYSNDDYDWELYKWSERDNPCHPSYYMSSEHKVSCNVTSSDLGVIAKSNSANQWWISVNNLLTTNPVSNVNINLYNYQLQSIGNAKTDGDGFAVIQAKGKAFALVAESGGQRTYLRLVEGEDNSLSRFDTGGKKIEKGLKGFIYGERGVWRPGDTLHISFILHDAEKHIPDNHPVSLEMYNARGQFHSKQIVTQGINGFYTYDVATQATDPTGLWNVYIKVGGTSFHKSFRVETIKPNRLKINLKLPENRLNASQGSVSATLSSAWLTGATARNLKAKVEMKLSKTTTQFKGFEKYIFNNPAADFTSETTEIFDGSLNDNGDVTFALKLPKAENAPGMLNAKLLARVFEPGGDASLYTQTIPFSPYPAYVGLNLNQAENRAIETDTDHRFDIVSLNSDGKMTNRNNIEYKIYKIDWSWWWENNGESLGNYINNSSYQPVASGKLQTVNGKANFKFKLKYPAWGRFLVYVKDKDSGHASGGTVFIDWPEYRGRGNKSDPDHIKMLTFSTDKPSYEIGEEITVIIPAAAEGKALVAVENGSTVLSRTWVDVSGKDTKYIFKATKEMAPNTYIHISLLQPHAQTVNDLPIRMYGIAPVTISNKESVLEPQIKMPDVLRPETEFTVEVSEQKGKAMTYTLAVVDDGLLDLTNFKTPNPWMEFYAREALGIRTWDIYDFVMGAFGGKYAAMFSIGGDETLNPADEKAKRFKPVVKFYGPFTLGKGDTKKHKITLPLYVGSVRTMVVAGQDGAFGKTEKTTPVRTPLMVLSSLPRVLSVNEKISLPVNVFAMENDVKSATVKIETSGLLQNTSSAQTVYFD